MGGKKKGGKEKERRFGGGGSCCFRFFVGLRVCHKRAKIRVLIFLCVAFFYPFKLSYYGSVYMK